MHISKIVRDMHSDLTAWRHELHAHPETAFEEWRTSAFVADRLASFGLEVHRDIGRTGVVAVLSNGSTRSLGLRADMDALNIKEENDVPYASRNMGKMHACGHDGHTVMLLGAAKYLSDFPPNGTVVFIFQPAEENEGGAGVMIEEGLFDRFPVDAVFGMHNWPELPVGSFGILTGAMMAANDSFELVIKGRGSHAAQPHLGIDPVSIAANIQLAWQQIVSRSLDPQAAAVISVTQVEAGEALNILPAEATLRGTVRTLTPKVRDYVEQELKNRAEKISVAFGASVKFRYERRYPPTINTIDEVAIARRAAEQVVGHGNVYTDLMPSMAAEDFAFMLEAKPGAYIWLGNGSGEHDRPLHNAHYDFNDDAIVVGVQYWLNLVKEMMGADCMAATPN